MKIFDGCAESLNTFNECLLSPLVTSTVQKIYWHIHVFFPVSILNVPHVVFTRCLHHLIIYSRVFHILVDLYIYSFICRLSNATKQENVGK